MSFENKNLSMVGEINGSIINLESEEAVTPAPAVKGEAFKERFRISKLPTGEELQTINAVIDGVPPPPQPSQEPPVAAGTEEGNTVKHVQLNLPLDYNEGTHHRTHTQTYTSGYMSHDAVPLSVFYRNQASMENCNGKDIRPTLDQLHKGENLDNAKMRHWVSSILFIYFIWSCFGTVFCDCLRCRGVAAGGSFPPPSNVHLNFNDNGVILLLK